MPDMMMLTCRVVCGGANGTCHGVEVTTTAPTNQSMTTPTIQPTTSSLTLPTMVGGGRVKVVDGKDVYADLRAGG